MIVSNFNYFYHRETADGDGALGECDSAAAAGSAAADNEDQRPASNFDGGTGAACVVDAMDFEACCSADDVYGGIGVGVLAKSADVTVDDVYVELDAGERRRQMLSNDPARQKLLTICGDANTDLAHRIV